MDLKGASAATDNADAPAMATPSVTRVKAEPDDGGMLSLLSDTIPMDDTEMAGPQSPPPGTMPSTEDDNSLMLEAEEEEEKPKPDLGLRYSGYTLPDVCLTIIVEPWTSTSSRAATREPSVIPIGPGATIQRSRFVGVAPVPREETEPPETPGAREQTPLFREFTPMPEAGSSSTGPDIRPRAPPTFGRNLPHVPLFHEMTPAPDDDRHTYFGFDDEDDDNGTSNLVQFSQAMNLGGTKSSGVANGDERDDDDQDVFRADADEGR